MPDLRIALAAAAIATAIVLPACQREPAPAAPAASVEPLPAPPVAPAPAKAPDAPMPEFPKLVVDTWQGGRFDLAEQRGKWVVVNFWATWCNPCLEEIPDLAAFDAAREDVVVVGLAFEEIEKADMDAFLEDHPVPYPFALVDVAAPPADFAVPRALPNTYLIAPDGRVAKAFYGPVTSEELAKLIVAAGPADAS
jgi:thiol-disulfide isomerase/thioredoxin